MQISLIGTSDTEDQKLLTQAYETGQLIARRGITLVCGGLGGAMAEACRGAFESGGDTLGVLPTLNPSDANPWVTHTVASGISHARNLAVVASGDAVIVLGGHWGTLSEIAFARELGLAVVCLGDWGIQFPDGFNAGLSYSDTPKEALDMAIAGSRALRLCDSEKADDKLDG